MSLMFKLGSLILFTKVISGLVYLFIVELVLLGLIKLFFDVFFLDQLFLALGLIFIGNLGCFETQEGMVGQLFWGLIRGCSCVETGV